MSAFNRKRGTGSSGQQTEPKPAAKPINHLEPPDHLNKDAKAFWRSMLPLVSQYLTEIDLGGFAEVAFAYSQMRIAQRDLDENGQKTVNERGVLIKNPAVATYRDFYNMYWSVGARFGLDPSSRTKLLQDANAATDNETSALSGLLR